MLSILTTLIIGLVIGFCAGAWANTAYQVRKRQLPRHARRTGDVERSQLSHDVAPSVFVIRGKVS
jgi:hypothetical protein